jgi:hypothetical protein
MNHGCGVVTIVEREKNKSKSLTTEDTEDHRVFFFLFSSVISVTSVVKLFAGGYIETFGPSL